MAAENMVTLDKIVLCKRRGLSFRRLKSTGLVSSYDYGPLGLNCCAPCATYGGRDDHLPRGHDRRGYADHAPPADLGSFWHVNAFNDPLVEDSVTHSATAPTRPSPRLEKHPQPEEINVDGRSGANGGSGPQAACYQPEGNPLRRRKLTTLCSSRPSAWSR